ncbi:unnamed protein product [Owenia fusiformis]|nr:unnamed protein product [Owenia fusiformis]
MLTRFSGRTQTVYTGVCIIYNQADNCSTDNKGADQINTFHDATDVTFSTMTSDVIQGYIDTGEPMGKAGGYGIQGIGGSLVESIHGDYYNVMGFPLNHFCRHLQEYLQNQTIA